MAALKTWSYSAATTFEKCPKQYFHLYVAKDIKQDPNTEHFLYGNEVHKACENYYKYGTALPAKFSQFQPIIEKINLIKGEKLAEYKVGLTKELEPCGFFDDNVFLRAVADLVILDRENGIATVIDWKTGKSSQYADTRQLSLLSMCIFKHFPEIKTIKSGLVFLVAKDMVREQFHVDNIDDMWAEWDVLTHRIDQAYQSNVFNAVPNFGCKSFCPVHSCPHSGK